MEWTAQTTTLFDCSSLLAKQGNLAADCCDSAVAPLTITHLSYDSRDVMPGTLFFCKGAHFEPEYLVKAVEAGAVAYVSEQDHAEYLKGAGIQAVPALLVREIRPAIARLAEFFYRGLTDQLTLIGFTGTKGKSTATYLLRAILDQWLIEQGKPNSAWLSSIENYDGVSCVRSLLTTQDVLELYGHFKNAVRSNIDYLTMEVSSQALKYGRTQAIPFEVAVFLNIGEDHISDIEHPSHEDYLASKLEIFKQSRVAIINRDCDEYERVLKAAGSCEKLLTFGCTDAADVVVSEIQATTQGLSFMVCSPEWQSRFTLPMAGQFNVENALAAIAAALALGVPLKHIQQGLASAEVSGRMQLIQGAPDKLIVVDYAHNKMSFEAVFASVAQEYPNRPIACVFGATGVKGLERRLDLPAVAVQYSDLIYLTEDDPLDEPLAQINEQIARVVREAGKTPRIIDDRSEAIERAIEDSPAGSVILVLGKGHETVMKRGKEAIPVPSDKERVETILSKLYQGDTRQ